MAQILIIDDDREICRFLSRWVEKMGHTAAVAHTLQHGLEECRAGLYDLILLDLEFPEGNGLEILSDLLQSPSAPEVIIVTGTGSVGGAELAFKYGAWDYVQKPVDFHEISLPIARALQYRNEKESARKPIALKRQKIIGESPAINACLEAVASAAAIDASVLVTGETGTGKELISKAIHENSKRASKPFIPVDCGALPESLVESCLFGHERSAFTGAREKREGLIRQANGGTLYLDEVGDLPLNIQTVLLRTLQERTIRPLGSDREIPVDFRLVAATNRDLDEIVKSKRFRQDLMYRIRAIEIKLPPLRERGSDVEKIAMVKTDELSRLYGYGAKAISSEFLETLSKYHWPGNIRELINILEHAIAAAGEDTVLYPIHLPSAFRASFLKIDDSQSVSAIEKITLPLKEFRRRTEKKYLIRLLNSVGDSRKEASRVSGISQSRLFELLKKHALSGTGSRIQIK